MELHAEGSGGHQSEAIDAVSDLSGQGEESAVRRHMTDGWASGCVGETQGCEEGAVEGDSVGGVEPVCG